MGQLPAEANAIGPDDYIDRLEAFGFSGAIFVQQDGVTLVNRGVGLADRDAGRRFTDRSIVNVASFSKPLTATAIMTLVEADVISLQDTLPAFFPATPSDKAQITVAQLLSHSAGLRHDSRFGGSGSADRDQSVDLMLSQPLQYAPGDGMKYSNDGYRFLAAIVEVATRRSYRDVVRDNVFQPAGMSTAGFVGEDRWPARSVAACYNEWRALGTFRDWTADRWSYEGSGSAAGSLTDLRKFVEAFFGGRIVSPENVIVMTTPHAEQDGDVYGFGWFIGRTAAGVPIINHGGDLTYHTEVRWYPNQQRTIIVLTTQEIYDESARGLGVHKRIIASNLSRLLDGVAFNPPPPAGRVRVRNANALLGRYALEDGAVWTVYRPTNEDADLWIGAIGQSAIDILEDADAATRAAFASANARSLELAAAIAAGSVAFAATLPDNLQFLVDPLVSEFNTMSGRLGDFQSVQLLGTRKEITGDDHMRTTLHMQFAGGHYDLAFGWRGDTLHEAITDTGAPHALMLPVATLSEHRFSTFNLVTQQSRGMEAASGRGNYVSLSIDGVQARRV